MSMKDNGEAPKHVYVLARVWSVHSEKDIGFKFYPDPHRLLYDHALQITSDVEMAVRES